MTTREHLEQRMEQAWMACTQAEQSGDVQEAVRLYGAYLDSYDAWCEAHRHQMHEEAVTEYQTVHHGPNWIDEDYPIE